MRGSLRPSAASYLIAVAAVAIVAAGRMAFAATLGDVAAFTSFLLAVTVAAWYGGTRPGLLATGLGGLLCTYFLVPPAQTLRVEIAEAAGLVAFAVTGAAISWFSGSLHAARREADDKKRRAQSLSDFLFELDGALRELEDPLEIERETTRRLGRHLGAPLSFISRLDAAAEHAHVERAWERDGTGRMAGTWEIKRFVTADLIAAWQLGETGVVEDALNDRRTDGPECAAAGFRAFVAAPCFHRDRLLVLLNVVDLEPRAWRDEEVVAVREAAARVGPTIAHAQAIRSLRASEALAREHWHELQTVTDAMSAPVVRCSRDLRYMWASRRYAEWLGRSQGELAGTPIVGVLGPEAFEQLRPHFERVLAGERVEYEERVALPGTGARWVHAVYTPTRDAVGEVDGWVAVVIDVDERRKLEEALRQADRRKDEFLATLAHELRNPLAPIRNAVQILKTVETPDQRAVWSREVIDRQLGQLTKLVDDLLDIARISRRRLELRREPCDLRGIVANALETSRPQIDEGAHQLTVELPAESLPLEVDPLRIAQVLSNLLNNAARYTPPGGHIRLSARRENGVVEISVSDDGVGIDPALRPHLFEISSTTVPVSGTSGGGLGIGLSLVRGLVELHGGTIEAHSEGVGRGSEFVVRLPLGAEAPPVVPQDDATAADRAPTRRVLVVDDNRDSADSLALLLRLRGHEVRVAYGGQEALAAAAVQHPDLALLDLGMPEVDGYEVCRQLRGQEWGRGMLVVALTGWGQDEDRRRSQRAGFDRHVVKPVAPQVLDELLAGPRSHDSSTRTMAPPAGASRRAQ